MSSYKRMMLSVVLVVITLPFLMGQGCGGSAPVNDDPAVPDSPVVPRSDPITGETLTITLPGNVPLVLVKIPAGTFQMGDISGIGYPEEQPVHTVTISNPFYIGKYEVTQAQWQAVMNSNPSSFKGDSRPVEQVSWNDCQSFCQAIQTKTGYTMRLPTEAEWEYACRAGTTTDYSFGDDTGRLVTYGWYNINSSSQSHDAGSKQSNPWGLYDMHGNVWEWCQDWYGNYSSASATDPVGPTNGTGRTRRGGAWNYFTTSLRSSLRNYGPPDERGSTFGFRLTLDTSTSSATIVTTVGSSGGRVQGSSGQILDIPQGALSQNVDIGLTSISSTSTDAPDGSKILGEVSCTPDGQTFAKPVFIQIPVDASIPDGTFVTVDTTTSNNATYGPSLMASGDYSFGVVMNHKVIFGTDHFSNYRCIMQHKAAIPYVREVTANVRTGAYAGDLLSGNNTQYGNIHLYLPPLACWQVRLNPPGGNNYEVGLVDYYETRVWHYKRLFMEMVLQTEDVDTAGFASAADKVVQNIETAKANGSNAINIAEALLLFDAIRKDIPTVAARFDKLNAKVSPLLTATNVGLGFLRGTLKAAILDAAYAGLAEQRIAAVDSLLQQKANLIDDKAMSDAWSEAKSTIMTELADRTARNERAMSETVGVATIEAALSLGSPYIAKGLAIAAFGAQVSTATLAKISFGVGFVLDVISDQVKWQAAESEMILAATLDNGILGDVCLSDGCINAQTFDPSQTAKFFWAEMRLHLEEHYWQVNHDFLTSRDASLPAKGWALLKTIQNDIDARLAGIAINNKDTIIGLERLLRSKMASSTSTTQVSQPTFSPDGGTFTSSQSVTISCSTSGATIRYTTDGSTPSQSNGTIISSDSAINITSTTTLKAIAYKTGMTDSPVKSALFTINAVSQVAQPTFSPDGGTFTSSQSVTISSATSGATIHYTTDGSAPSQSNGTIITNGGSVNLTTTTTLQAIAYKSGMTDSTVRSATYTHTGGGGGTGETFTITLPGNVPLVLVKIPAGTFQMGDISGIGYSTEKPVHTVTISNPFYIGKYEVTQAQWQAVMNSNPSSFKGDSRPVEQVSWNDCQSFCQAVQIQTGYAVRLPTEAQWEYACRAGTSTDYCFGDDITQLGNYAWYSGNSSSQTHDVGSKQPNALDLYDMHGNVWEWCQDWYSLYSSGSQTDPVGPSSGSGRIRRGGPWNYGTTSQRSSLRNYGTPSERGNVFGFRLVLDSN